MNQNTRISLALSLLLAFIALTIPYPAGADTYYPFPDTGQTKCYDNTEEITCPQPGQPFYGQDAQYQPRLPRSYTKLGHGGVILANNALHVDDGGPWMMTKDNVTGNTWEIKRGDNSNDKYSWQDAQDVFLEDLNNSSFGGYNDWRLPTAAELASLIYNDIPLDEPLIEVEWFPHTASNTYWSATTFQSNHDDAWIAGFYDYGGLSHGNKSNSYHVYAVRSSRTISFDDLVMHNDGTFSDPNTGLMWQMETAPGKYTWEQALEYAESLTLAGYSDWRLPTRNELYSLVDYSMADPSVDRILAEYTLPWPYWTSTTSRTENTGFSIHVVFDRGYIGSDNKIGNHYVRAVRSSIPTYTVSVDTQDNDFGVVDGSGTYLSGDDVTVTAIPNPGYRFLYWSEDGQDVSTEAEYTFTLANDRTLVAHFGENYFPFPDTGQSKCYNDTEEITCPQPGEAFYGQDAQYQPRLPRSYTKLGHGGVILADDALHVDDGGQWLMTKDNVTGLIWELKTQGNKDDTYSSWQEARDVFIRSLNAARHGGFSDWRMPTVAELSSLVNSDIPSPSPTIDKTWFPNTVASWYWSSTPLARSYGTWMVDFVKGSVGYIYRNHGSYYYTRAVRLGHSSTIQFDDLDIYEDGTFSDPNTGLMWQMKTAGSYTWENSLKYVKNMLLNGLNDWRLPSRNELHSLINYSMYWPSVTTAIKEDTLLSCYWSSTTYVINSDNAWHVDFSDGNVENSNKSNRCYVRAVRLGHSNIDSLGSLAISIEPAEVVADGAQWRRTGTSTWFDSGTTENNVPVGSHTVEFKDVGGWTKPENVTVTVVEGQTATATGTYVHSDQTGSISITIEPQAARESGAQWRRTGTSTWLNSGATESDVPTGTHTVEFKTLSGWTTPDSVSVTVSEGQVATATGTYVINTYTVTPSANADGSITPDTPQTINHGAAATFTVTANQGYMATVSGTCGGNLVGDTFTTNPITASCTVMASFRSQENRAPIVEVTEQQIFLANMGGTAVLDASPSSDPDGDVLFFSWRELHENPHHGLIPLVGDSLAKLHVSFPAPGRYQFDVRVSDGVLMSQETKSITVYVPGIKGLVGYTPSDALVRVPDAVVRVHTTAADARNNVNPVDLAISDSLGRYVLENVEPEDNETGRTYFAQVDRNGFQSTGILTLAVLPDPGFEDQREDHAIGRGHLATMTGFVRTTEGTPIVNALVSITPGLGSQVFASTTNSNGRFQMSNVPKGSWIMQLRADGYRPEVRDVNVADGMAELQYTMQATPGTGTLSGTVHLAGTERPVANALVKLGTGTEAYSDGQGVYTFSAIPVGDYILTVTRDGYEPKRLPVVPVRTGDNTLDLPISFATRGVLVFGTVTDATSGNPVRLATVGIEGTAGLLSHSDVSDSTGFYQLRDAPTGEQRFRVSAPGYVAKTFTDTITSGRAMNIALERAENWTAPVIPGQGRPEARVEQEFIFLNSMRQSAWLDARPSGTNIRYVWRESPDNPVLGLLPVGSETRDSIQISGFSKPGMYIFELQVQRDGLLSANTAVMTVFAPGLAGNVHASPSDGIFGLNAALVRAYAHFDDAATWNDNFIDSTQTSDNPSGNFALRNLSPGAYWIVAQAQSGTGFNQYGPVKRRVGSNTVARQTQINMPREEFSLSGTITDATSRLPLENVRVIVAPGSLSESYRTTTDATGRFLLSSVPQGSGQPVMLMREGYRTLVSLVDISGDTTHDMTLTADPEARLASLSGRVTADFQGILLPVYNAEVIIGSGLYRTFTDADGFYEIANLPPGHYYGTIRKPGYIPQGLADMTFATLNPGPNTINKRLTFAANGPVIRGTVINAGQEPIPGVTIRVLEPSGRFAAWAGTPEADEMRADLARERRHKGLPRTVTPPQSDPGGTFQMIDLPHGQRQIEARLPDGRTAVKTVNVDGNMKLVFSEADFLSTHVLTYTAETGGRIEGTTPQNVTDGGNGTPVRAVPIPGYRFVRWSDGLTTAQRQHTNVTQNITVTAEFAANPSVTVTPTVPDGGGRVEVTGGNSHPGGSLVVFRAIADSGLVFSHWTLDGERVAGAGAVHTFAVSENMNLTAHFKEVKGLPGVLMLLLEG